MLVLGVFVAGALGAMARYTIDGFIQQRWHGPFPMGTFAINVSGSLVLGGITGYFVAHAAAPADFKVIVGTGFVGAYTTFSTLTYESLRLLLDKARLELVLNLVGSVIVGLVVAGVGIFIGQRL